MSDYELTSSQIRTNYFQIQEDLIKLRKQLCDKDREIHQMQSELQLYVKSTNSTSSQFPLSFEFKNQWLVFIQNTLLESFDTIYSDLYLLSKVIQLSIRIIYDRTKQFLNDKIIVLLTLLGINEQTPDIINTFTNKYRKVLLQEYYKTYFKCTLELIEDIISKIKRAIANKKDEEALFTQEEIDDVHKDLNVDSIKKYVEEAVYISLFMLLHDPPLMFYTSPIAKYYFYTKGEVVNIGGFPKENSPCLLILSPPMLRPNNPFNGFKSAVYACEKATEEIVGQCEEYKMMKNNNKKHTKSFSVNNENNQSFQKQLIDNGQEVNIVQEINTPLKKANNNKDKLRLTTSLSSKSSQDLYQKSDVSNSNNNSANVLNGNNICNSNNKESVGVSQLNHELSPGSVIQKQRNSNCKKPKKKNKEKNKPEIEIQCISIPSSKTATTSNWKNHLKTMNKYRIKENITSHTNPLGLGSGLGLNLGVKKPIANNQTNKTITISIENNDDTKSTTMKQKDQLKDLTQPHALAKQIDPSINKNNQNENANNNQSVDKSRNNSQIENNFDTNRFDTSKSFDPPLTTEIKDTQHLIMQNDFKTPAIKVKDNSNNHSFISNKYETSTKLSLKHLRFNSNINSIIANNQRKQNSTNTNGDITNPLITIKKLGAKSSNYLKEGILQSNTKEFNEHYQANQIKSKARRDVEYDSFSYRNLETYGDQYNNTHTNIINTMNTQYIKNTSNMGENEYYNEMKTNNNNNPNSNHNPGFDINNTSFNSSLTSNTNLNYMSTISLKQNIIGGNGGSISNKYFQSNSNNGSRASLLYPSNINAKNKNPETNQSKSSTQGGEHGTSNNNKISPSLYNAGKNQIDHNNHKTKTESDIIVTEKMNTVNSIGKGLLISNNIKFNRLKNIELGIKKKETYTNCTSIKKNIKSNMNNANDMHLKYNISTNQYQSYSSSLRLSAAKDRLKPNSNNNNSKLTTTTLTQPVSATIGSCNHMSSQNNLKQSKPISSITTFQARKIRDLGFQLYHNSNSINGKHKEKDNAIRFSNPLNSKTYTNLNSNANNIMY